MIKLQHLSPQHPAPVPSTQHPAPASCTLAPSHLPQKRNWDLEQQVLIKPVDTYDHPVPFANLDQFACQSDERTAYYLNIIPLGEIFRSDFNLGIAVHQQPQIINLLLWD